jgi:hypothetical protein
MPAAFPSSTRIRTHHPAVSRLDRVNGVAGGRKQLTEKQARAIIDTARLVKAPDWPETHCWHVGANLIFNVRRRMVLRT